jgi:hypothetical protein
MVMLPEPARASGKSGSSAVLTTKHIAAQATDVTVKIHKHVSAKRCKILNSGRTTKVLTQDPSLTQRRCSLHWTIVVN